MTAPRAEGTALERAMEALERLRDYFDQRADADAVGDPMRYQGNVEMHRLRDCDELLAALRSRDADIAWAKFGAWAFEQFWHDSEPGDIDAADAQEKAVELGLLARTAEVDAGATHAEECEWQAGAPLSECCCYTPTRARREGGSDAAASQ